LRKFFVLIFLAVTSCERVENSYPVISEVGFGKVLTVEDIVGDSGESEAARYVAGYVSGGVVGAVIVGNADKNIGRSALFSYTLQLSDGSNLTLRSFSAVAVGDCVKAMKMSNRAEMVLERQEDGKLCEVKKSS
jgi:hypothetical protein